MGGMREGRAARRVVLWLVCVCLSEMGWAAAPSRNDAKRPLDVEKDSANWTTVGGTSDEPHYSPLALLNPSNISQLRLAWYGDFSSNRGQEATPVVVDGVLYTSGSWSK